MGPIPGWGTKVPHALQCGQKKKRKKERKKEKKGNVDSSLDESKLTNTDSHLNYPMTLWWDELFITNDALLFFYLKTSHSFWKHP